MGAWLTHVVCELVRERMTENAEGSVASNSAKTDKTLEFAFSHAPSLEDMLDIQPIFMPS